jgi:hypothetical protein
MNDWLHAHHTHEFFNKHANLLTRPSNAALFSLTAYLLYKKNCISTFYAPVLIKEQGIRFS